MPGRRPPWGPRVAWKAIDRGAHVEQTAAIGRNRHRERHPLAGRARGGDGGRRCTFELITGGLSNLTYRVTDAAGWRWVLRRPPLGHVLATAHDMAREHRIIAALAPTAVPVPPLVGLMHDDDRDRRPVLRDGARRRRRGARRRGGVGPRHGRSVPGRGGRSSRSSPPSTRSTSTPSGSATSAAARPTSSASSRAGTRQWEATRDPAVDVPVVDELHDRLAAAVPAQGPATIVHGDYRLDNCILGADGTVAAVLDWELCTLGDPLADVGPAPRVLGRARRRHPTTGLPTRHRARRASRAAPSCSTAYAAPLGTRRLPGRLLRRPRLLEAGLHPPGRPGRATSRGRDGRDRRGRGRFSGQVAALGQAGHGRPRRCTGRSPWLSCTNSLEARTWPRPTLLVVALDGWIDAGFAAANAVGTVLEDLEHRHRRHVRRRRAARPPVPPARPCTWSDGVNTGLTWPSIELRAARRRRRQRGPVPGRGRARPPVAGLLRRGRGPGPASSASQRSLGLGAYPAPTPHTRADAGRRPRHLAPSWPTRSARFAGRIDVPAGVHAAIERQLRRRAASPPWACGPRSRTTRRPCPIPDAGGWRSVEGLSTVGGLSLPARAPWPRTPRRPGTVSTSWSPTATSTAMVRQLEAQVDAMAGDHRRPVAQRRRPRRRAGAVPARPGVAAAGPAPARSAGDDVHQLRRPGDDLAGRLPSRWACTFSLARARRSASAASMPAGTSRRSRTLPLTCTTIVTVSTTSLAGSATGQRCACTWPPRAPLPQLGGDVRGHGRHQQQQGVDGLVEGRGAAAPLGALDVAVELVGELHEGGHGGVVRPALVLVGDPGDEPVGGPVDRRRRRRSARRSTGALPTSPTARRHSRCRNRDAALDAARPPSRRRPGAAPRTGGPGAGRRRRRCRGSPRARPGCPSTSTSCRRRGGSCPG